MNGTFKHLEEMSSTTLEHFSHPEHPLILKEEVVVGDDDVCYGCNKPVVGLPTYTCTCTEIDCQSFYLHKSCAELPSQINHILVHIQHPLSLVPSLDSGSSCDICKLEWERFSYRCDFCDFDVCFNCATADEVERVIHHIGHDKKDHSLSLIQRQALFLCDACGEEWKDFSYICTSCEFWMHKSCAYSPLTIETPTYHHHPLNLVFSIPDIHRTFNRNCGICDKVVYKNHWLYYCQKCTYFVHITCATSSDTESMRIEILGDCLDDEPDLLQIPLPSEESLLDLLIKQFNEFEVEFPGEGSIISNTSTISSLLADPPGFIWHWSHDSHPLELLQFSNTSSCDQNDDDDDDDKPVSICDGCVLPITAAHPSYYACAICQYFLHLFCATKLPLKLPAGASVSHPQHTLLVAKPRKFYNLALCDACDYYINGFFYLCKTCDIVVDIRCALLPKRIKHESHKHHTLIQRPPSTTKLLCSLARVSLEYSMYYGCESCNSFQIHRLSAFYPSRLKHRYDLHTVALKTPPFFYEGVIYCEICEEEANNQWWLYHCSECDQSFHTFCLHRGDSVKTGGEIVYAIDNQPHTLTLVQKIGTRKNPLYFCSNCCKNYGTHFFLECGGCGFLMCHDCAVEIFG